MSKKVLITGSGGFIGGFIVDEALRRGYEVWAAVRKSTSRVYLQDERINFIELDFTSEANLKQALADKAAEIGKWDYIVHNLGATKCANFLDFNRINYGYLKLFVETLIELNIVPTKFLMMSTMGVLGEGDEVNYEPFTDKNIPLPNTKYGVSKLKAETFLEMQPDFPFIALRPTGVYGPREKDYYLMIKCIAKGFDFSVGYKKQLLSFIYVKDLARVVFDALESDKVRTKYLIAEGETYTQKQFRNLVKKELHKKFVLPVVLPLWIVKIVSVIAEKIAVAQMKTSTLNRDKFKIMKQRNWKCDITKAREELEFQPEYDLERGLHEAIEWYKQEKWL